MRRGLEPVPAVSCWGDRRTHSFTAALVPRTGYSVDLGIRGVNKPLGQIRRIFHVLVHARERPGSSFNLAGGARDTCALRAPGRTGAPMHSLAE